MAISPIEERDFMGSKRYNSFNFPSGQEEKAQSGGFASTFLQKNLPALFQSL
jgi:hypothetical protein